MSMDLLRRKMSDSEYERRFNSRYAEHLLMLLPLLLFAAVTYWHLGELSLPAVLVAAISYLIIAGIFYARARRDALRSLHRDGLVERDYKPPF